MIKHTQYELDEFQKWWKEAFDEITDEDGEKDFAFRGFIKGFEVGRKITNQSRGRDMPCCDSPGREKCDQCQEVGLIRR